VKNRTKLTVYVYVGKRGKQDKIDRIRIRRLIGGKQDKFGREK
jgi:hypothetical protein